MTEDVKVFTIAAMREEREELIRKKVGDFDQ